MDPEDMASGSAARPDLVVLYDDHPEAVIDVFLPRGPSEVRQASVAVVLHGGFWRQEWDRTHLRPLARALAAEGFVVATPEYRRGAGHWPPMRHDVEAALRDVRALVARAAPGYVDPTAPAVVAGHSAGGHLALWAGLHAGPEVVARIVALAPVTDVRYAARTRMGSSAAQELLGGDPDQVPTAYADADVVTLLPGGVPVTLIQGDADLQVPVSMNRELSTSLAAGNGGAPFRYVELPGVDHFALIDPSSDAWPTVLRALTAHS